MTSWSSREYIGSHDSGIIINRIGYKSKRALHDYKVGLTEDSKPTDMMQLGLFQEDWILQKYAENELADGQKLIVGYSQTEGVRSGEDWQLLDTSGPDVPERYAYKLHLQSKILSYWRGSPDALVMGAGKIDKGVDAKSVFDIDSSKLIQDGILPDKMKLQGRHFCMLMNVPEWDFYCLLNSSFGRLVKLTYRADLSIPNRTRFIKELKTFWGNVLSDNPPTFDGSEGDYVPQAIKARYSDASGEQAVAPEQLNLITNAIKAKKKWTEGEEDYRKLSGMLADTMGVGAKKLMLADEWLCTLQKNGSFRFSEYATKRALGGK